MKDKPPPPAPPPRRSNVERTDTTRRALLAAARALFVEKGYGNTSTPEVVAAAGITRGALYHHFADKLDLFRAVLAQEAATVAQEIEAAAPTGLSPRAALMAGSAAYLESMSVPGRTRLLLIEGPAVLGTAEMAALDAAHAQRTLRQGLEAVLAGGKGAALSIDALAALLGAAFDRAALAIQDGGNAADYSAALTALVDCAVRRARRA